MIEYSSRCSIMKITAARLKKLVSRFPGKKILVVGDLILDHYIIGRVERISPEAPVPVVWANKEDFVCGGAANVGLNIAAFNANSYVCGPIGKDSFGRRLMECLKKGRINTDFVTADKTRPTTIKTRIVGNRQQVVRVDWESVEPLSYDLDKAFIARIKKNIKNFDAVIIEDYGKGMINAEITGELVAICRENKKIVTVDPKEENIDLYKGVTCLTPNLKEAQVAAGIKIYGRKDVPLVGELILKRLHPEALLITLGEDGMMLFEGKERRHLPAAALEVFDVSGAGDTVIAVFTLALACGASFYEAAYISNLAAGIVVGKAGTAVTNAKELAEKIVETVN